jgi:DNA integrity scanning protein DisA with diadenylate cyclase activity
MTKEELEVKISTLQTLVIQKNEELSEYAAQIERLNDELKDLNKPKLTPMQLDELYQAIEQGIESFDFDDQDNYETDFHIDYDNRIAIESMSFHNADELLRVVYNEARELFAEAKLPEDEISTQEHLNQH